MTLARFRCRNVIAVGFPDVETRTRWGFYLSIVTL